MLETDKSENQCCNSIDQKETQAVHKTEAVGLIGSGCRE